MLCVELHILCSELLNSFCLGYSIFLFQMCFMLVIYFQNNSCIPFLLVAINCGKEKNVKLLSRGKERLFKSQKKKKKTNKEANQCQGCSNAPLVISCSTCWVSSSTTQESWEREMSYEVRVWGLEFYQRCRSPHLIQSFHFTGRKEMKLREEKNDLPKSHS